MFTRLKTWLVTWAEHYQRREIERLHEEGCRLKKEVLKLAGKARIPLLPEERRLLMEKAKRIDPQILKQISQFDLQDLHPQSSDDTSTESS
jgi:hypothetical protein